MERQLNEFESVAPRNDTLSDVPALGLEATARILKAKVDVLEEELKALIKERQEKETHLAVAFEKIKSLDDQKIKDQRQLNSLTVIKNHEIGAYKTFYLSRAKMKSCKKILTKH